MFAASKTAPPAGGTPDPQFNYVTMLLHGDGTNGAQNNTFVDSSSNGYSLTRGGSLTQGSFSPYGSNWSNYFNGSSGLSSSVSSATKFSGNFTVEAWVNPTATGLGAILDTRATDASSGGFYFGLYGSTNQILVYTSNSFAINAGSVPVGTWTHVALVRNSSTWTVYVNGSSVATYSSSANLSDGNTQIGSSLTVTGSGSNYLNGYLSNLRVNNTTAVYTGSFTPSTTPLTAISGTSLLTCQSNRFIDNSTNVATISLSGSPSVQRFNPFGTSTAYSTATIGASAYNPGAAYLTTSYSGSVGSTDDFTVEGWFYVTANADNGSFVLNSGTLGIIMTQSGQKLSTYIPSVGFVVWQASALVQNTWHYIVVQRSLSVLSCYLNGTRLGTQVGAIGGWTYNGAGLYLTGSNATREIGYYTDIRISTIARYAGTTMTVPTAPLASDANTTFLLSMKNGAIYDNAMMNDLQTANTAQISTSVKKYGTGSMYFPATTDRLVPAYTNSICFALGAGDFTIEGWMYMPTISGSGYGNIMCSGASAAQFLLSCGTTGWAGTDNKLNFNPGSDTVVTSTTTVTNSTWHHFAVVRSGSSYKMFIDGTLEATGAATAIDFKQWGSDTYVGIGAGYHLAQPGTYLDDVRITKGYARYTTTFTPPTAAFPNTGPN